MWFFCTGIAMDKCVIIVPITALMQWMMVMLFFFSVFRLWHNKGKVLIALLLVGILAAIYNIDGSHQSVSIYVYTSVSPMYPVLVVVSRLTICAML
mgnify:CR=1 FL=1